MNIDRHCNEYENSEIHQESEEDESENKERAEHDDAWMVYSCDQKNASMSFRILRPRCESKSGWSKS